MEQFGLILEILILVVLIVVELGSEAGEVNHTGTKGYSQNKAII